MRMEAAEGLRLSALERAGILDFEGVCLRTAKRNSTCDNSGIAMRNGLNSGQM